jgi:hypothetical protein
MALQFNTIFSKNNRHTVSMVLPLWIGLKNDPEWMFPVEPLITVSGKNIIVKRNVAKSEHTGTIKERWSQDDFSIKIQGSFIHPDLHTYPANDVQKLMYYIRQKTALSVNNELFAMFDINQIVIESYSFPFSKGENVQNFSIDACSDNLYKLFIDVKDV